MCWTTAAIRPEPNDHRQGSLNPICAIIIPTLLILSQVPERHYSMPIHTAGNMWRAEQSSVLFVYLRCITLNCVSHICVSIGKSHSEEACKSVAFFMQRNSLDGTDLSRITLNISLDTEMKHKPEGVCLKNSSCHSHGKLIVFPRTYAPTQT